MNDWFQDKQYITNDFNMSFRLLFCFFTKYKYIKVIK